jgi:hypothetical protein
MTKAMGGTRRWQFVIVAVCVGVLVFTAYRQIVAQSSQPTQNDFHTYFISALAVRHHADPLAPAAAWIRTYHPGNVLIPNYYVYSPLLAILLIPLTFLPYTTALIVWDICNIVFLLLVVFALFRIAEDHPSLMQVLLVTALASIVGTVRLEIYWGQADIFVLCLVCGAFWLRLEQRSRLAGVALALACIIKPPLLIFAAILLWKREFAFLASTVVAGVVLLFVPFLWLGEHALGNMVAVWRFWSASWTPYIDNQSPKGVLARLFTINPYVQPVIQAPILVTILWLAIALVVAVILFAFISPSNLETGLTSLLEMGITIAALLLISPLSESIYMALLIVPMIATLLWLRTHAWSSSQYRHAAVLWGALWLVLCLPLDRVKGAALPHLSGGSSLRVLFVLAAAPFLYCAIASFALIVWVASVGAVGEHGDIRLLNRIGHLFTSAPALVSSWIHDLKAWVGSPRPIHRE